MNATDTQKNVPTAQPEPNKYGEDLCKKGLYCAESVLAVIAQDHNVESPLIPRIATGLCSGMARTCGTCGALSGGILAINLVHGRDTAEHSVEDNYALVGELIKRFEKDFKSTNCAQLLGCDLGTEAGQQTFSEENLIERCRVYTQQSISIVRDLLANKPKHQE